MHKLFKKNNHFHHLNKDYSFKNDNLKSDFSSKKQRNFGQNKRSYLLKYG